MQVALGWHDGPQHAVDRVVRVRETPEGMAADRDLEMLVRSCQGWTHARIAGLFRCTPSNVSIRLGKLPPAIVDAANRLIRERPDGLTIEMAERLRNALIEIRERRRATA